ncbi:MAG: DUF3781 domain-containing protein [Bacilli bacterium]|nr:DUF3781 domain-containing protein [Bacilli bacterium]
MKNELIKKIDKIHTTSLGMKRIKTNLNIEASGVDYCKNILLNEDSIVYKNGKNYYLKYNNILFTINSFSYTIITAHII